MKAAIFAGKMSLKPEAPILSVANNLKINASYQKKHDSTNQKSCSFPFSTLHGLIKSCREVSCDEAHKNIKENSCCHECAP